MNMESRIYSIQSLVEANVEEKLVSSVAKFNLCECICHSKFENLLQYLATYYILRIIRRTLNLFSQNLFVLLIHGSRDALCYRPIYCL